MSKYVDLSYYFVNVYFHKSKQDPRAAWDLYYLPGCVTKFGDKSDDQTNCERNHHDSEADQQIVVTSNRADDGANH